MYPLDEKTKLKTQVLIDEDWDFGTILQSMLKEEHDNRNKRKLLNEAIRRANEQQERIYETTGSSKEPPRDEENKTKPTF